MKIGEKEYSEILVTDVEGNLLASITDNDIIEEKNCKVVCVPDGNMRTGEGKVNLINDVEGFKEMCQPIIAYLRKNCDPYTEVHISMDEIKVTSVECGIAVEKNDD